MLAVPNAQLTSSLGPAACGPAVEVYATFFEGGRPRRIKGASVDPVNVSVNSPRAERRSRAGARRVRAPREQHDAAQVVVPRAGQA